MNKETVQMIAQFMGRVTLQANEIEAFQKCQAALQEEFEQCATQELSEDA